MWLQRALRHLGFGWKTHHSTSVWAYQEHTTTGARRAIRRRVDGYQPMDHTWLNRLGRVEGPVPVALCMRCRTRMEPMIDAPPACRSCSPEAFLEVAASEDMTPGDLLAQLVSTHAGSLHDLDVGPELAALVDGEA